MARAPAAIKLPRSYYKRRTPPPAIRLKDQRFVATLQGNLGSVGPDRNKGVTALRKILLQDLATAIVDDTRAIHINTTMAYWRGVRSKGFLDDEVAIIVDGSPQRPIKNVKFAGIIDIVSPASVELIIEATEFAWGFLIDYARKFPSVSQSDGSYDRKKTWPTAYHKSFEVFVSDKKQIMSPADLRRSGAIEADDWTSIQNYVPYAAKLERYRYPQGAYVVAFKQLRKKYGSRLAIRFDYVEGQTTMKRAGGAPTPQPVLRIGQPGAFPSRMPNIRKYRRDSIKRGNAF